MSGLEKYPRITPFLWFNANAEEAVNFYLSVFKDSRRLSEMRTGEGSILTIAFELDGQKFTALNGGPMFKFTEAVSFVVRCDTQQEVDEYWSKLTAGGSESQCGWLKDKFGLSWQVGAIALTELMASSDAQRVKRMTQAMFKMKKLDISTLERAYNS